MKNLLKISLFLLLWAPFSPALAKEAKDKVMVVVGDSLTEGYGIKKEDAFPALLELKLKAAGFNWKVINSGVSGSTSASGPGRVDWAMKTKPDVLFLALGANDGLRGLKTSEMEKNLRKAIASAKAAGATVYLAGMQMPPNFGKEYGDSFQAVFPRVANLEKITLFPFLLEGVAGNNRLNLADRIHPNEEGHKIMAENLFQFFKGKL